VLWGDLYAGQAFSEFSELLVENIPDIDVYDFTKKTKGRLTFKCTCMCIRCCKGRCTWQAQMTNIQYTCMSVTLGWFIAMIRVSQRDLYRSMTR